MRYEDPFVAQDSEELLEGEAAFAAELVRRAKRLFAVVCVAAIVGMAAKVAHCEEPAPAFRYRLETWTMTLAKAGEDRRLIFGARAAADYALPGAVHLVGRIDASALPTDGGTPNVSLTDLSSAQTLELYGGLWRDVYGPFALTVIGGTSTPLEGGQVPALERYPRTYGAGVLAGDGTGDRWLLLAAGKHEAAGDGLKLLASCQWGLAGRTSIVADAVIGGPGSFVRAGMAVRLQ